MASTCQQQAQWTIATVLLLLLAVHGGQTSTEQQDYDPWKESDRPKVVVDYHNGPLRGKLLLLLKQGQLLISLLMSSFMLLPYMS